MISLLIGVGALVLAVVGARSSTLGRDHLMLTMTTTHRTRSHCRFGVARESRGRCAWADNRLTRRDASGYLPDWAEGPRSVRRLPCFLDRS
jgi:hypothetical protein